jgi:oligopeptide/dipeptide ABC transporter ATP-binding protein
VMYAGKIVEFGEREQVFASPQHSYTQTLLNAVPRLGGGTEPVSTGGQQ